MLRTLLALCLLSVSTHAVDFYVDNVNGKDDHDGLSAVVADGHGPLHTINLALRKAGAGDTIHLADTGVMYRQVINLYEHPGGKEGAPLVIDGHGATLTGADVASPEGWQTYQGGTLKRQDLVGMVIIDGAFAEFLRPFNCLEPEEICYAPNFFKRLFFRFPEGKKPTDYTIEVGQPDGTSVTLDPASFQLSHSTIRGVMRYNGLQQPTWVKVDGVEKSLVKASDRLQAGQYTIEDDILYFMPPEGEWQARDIRVIVRANGVMMNGTTAWVTVRNVNVTLVSNDGFNIHGKVTNAEFYNCNAWDCGDEGFSSHDQCETLLDGAVYTNCDNGIANVNTHGWSITRNVDIRRSRSVGYLITTSTPDAWHTLENAIFVDNPSQISANYTKIDNVLILGTGGAPRTQALSLGPATEVNRATLAGNQDTIRLGEKTRLTLAKTVIGPDQGNIHLRTADPFSVWTLHDVRFAAGQKIEWGAKWPWTTKLIEEWLAEAAEAAIVTDCALHELTTEQILSGEADSGCSAELLDLWRARRE